MMITMVEELARQRRADLLEQACRDRLRRLAMSKARPAAHAPRCEQDH
jgi:hypothetical protein